MKILKNSIYVFIITCLVSCGIPQAEYDTLKKENELLKEEIAECSLTPAELFEQANTFYDTEEYIASRKKLKTLLTKYVDSKEAKKGKYFLKKVENKILETARSKNKQAESIPEEEETTVAMSDQEIEKALAKMKKKYDIDNDVTWYTDKTSTKLNTKNYIQAYIGKKEKKPWLGLTINYFSKKKWLHTERIEITVDGKTFEINENDPDEFKEKEESGGKREWLDRVIKSEDIRLTQKIASSKTAKIKFVGEDDIYSRTISKTEKKSLKNVLNAFEALGGNIN